MELMIYELRRGGRETSKIMDDAADKLERVQAFLLAVKDVETAPSAEWVAAQARELLA